MTWFRRNVASADEIASLFESCDFSPPLETYISDIGDYIDKILSNAERIEVWDKSRLLGLLAFYANDTESKVAFITMISVSREASGKGIGSMLMDKCISLCSDKGYRVIDLEVRNGNGRAIHLYQKKGFKVTIKNIDTIIMRLDLND